MNSCEAQLLGEHVRRAEGVHYGRLGVGCAARVSVQWLTIDTNGF